MGDQIFVFIVTQREWATLQPFVDNAKGSFLRNPSPIMSKHTGAFIDVEVQIHITKKNPFTRTKCCNHSEKAPPFFLTPFTIRSPHASNEFFTRAFIRRMACQTGKIVEKLLKIIWLVDRR